MKKIFFVLMMCALSATTVVAGKIKRIDPTDWFVGMKNAKLQLMVYGESIGKAQVSTAWPGVRIDSVVRLDSPNYLLVYLDLSDAKAGNMPLVFTQGKQKSTINYRLREREMSGEQRRGFSNADVLYMLMPDRFASSGTKKHPMPGLNAYRVDRSQPSLRHGGDLEGIRQHLNYFTQLGVTALWFTPVLENNAADKGDYNMYHGYGTTDYYKVDPRFGTNAEYRRLINDAHAKGLKVVMDMIFNHCGITHPWVKEMPSRNWFNRPDYKNHYLQTSYKLTPVLDPYASKVDMDETVDGWFVPEYPDLNQRNPHVLRYLIQNSIWWIETVGIDGIRMDTYPYADREAMAKWMARINQEYPNFNTVGETWVTEPAYTAAWQEGSKLSTIDSHLKTVMDFAFFDRINRAKNEETDGWWNGLNRVYNALCYDYLYPNPSSVMAFIENHDTDRFLGNGSDTLALKQALALLLTMNRIPQLYYGTEILMNGTKEKTDGNVRKDFPGGFPGDKQNAFTAEGRTKEQNAMFVWLSRLLHWRKGNNVITQGRQTHFIPFNGIYVLVRTLDKRRVLTIMNGTSKSATMPVARYAEVIGDAHEARDVLTGRTINLQNDIKLAPRATLVLELF
ncbi:glycoside hydrolase family 13 protein [Hoylesella saccharolytica]|uniref:glycoside hydrolase family 13 protein n=1 Tax=Hoylesella saccharolytica TaxID=633701 RepID=UPI0028EEF8DF|nr:glycoside hydrolase family 13 protein [Hoylesella saccharolytica]